MAGVVTSALTAAIRTDAAVGVVDTTWRNLDVIGRFPLRDPTGGGNVYNRKMQYGSNSSVGRYSEGDAVGTAGSQSYVTAAWGVSYYKAVIQITGHARDQLKNGNPSAAFFNQLELEMTTGVKDIKDLVSNDFLGTGLSNPVGIQGIVDSAGTIAGLSRTTYTWFGAYEVGGSGTTVTLADLDSAERFSRDSDYSSNFDTVWTSWKQVQKLKGVIGNAGQSNNSIFIQQPGSNQPIQISNVGNGISWGPYMIEPIRDLDNSIFLGLTMSDFFAVRSRDLTVDPLGKGDDSEKFLMTLGIGLACENPKHSWKVTGYTA